MNGRDRLRKFVDDLKLSTGCGNCGYSKYAASLEFHHLDSGKEHNISEMRRNCASRDRILKEVAKCEVLCSNCHRVLHATE